MDNFIKVLSSIGPQYINIKWLNAIQVQNNGPTDWYVAALFDPSMGTYAVIDGITSANEAHALARELAQSLGFIDPEEFK